MGAQLACAEQQLDELRRVSRRPFFQERLTASEIGRMVNDIRRLATMCSPLPDVSASPDPNDDFLLAIAQTADADYLVTGDKSDLLALGSHGRTRIVSARAMVQLLNP